MTTRTITIEVTDEQLAKMVKGLEETAPHYKVLDAAKLLQLLLQKEADNADIYLDRCIDGGGNELLGDCLDEEECKGIAEEINV